MKKNKSIITIFALMLVILIGITGCSGQNERSENNKILKVGAVPTPHGEILEHAKKALADKGYDLEVVEFNDYVLPNQALAEGEIDANFFQHLPYLENYNEEHGSDLISVASIHFEPLGIYPGKTKALKDLKDGAEIAVPNDATNEARALLLLEQEGLITLSDAAGLTATVKDITENPKNLQIKEIDAAQVARSVSDVDLAVINGNYALESGLDVSKDALALEGENSESAKTYANIVAIKKGNENEEKIKALVEVLQSEDVKKFIEEKYKGAIIPVF